MTKKAEKTHPISCDVHSEITSILIILFKHPNNSTFEGVEEVKYLGTTLTNQNSIPEEIKSRLRSRNACYLSVQNLLTSRLLSKNLKIKIYKLRGLSPHANYTDRAAATGRRS